VHAWSGYLTFIDRSYQGNHAMFPLHGIDLRCSTHSYEGRFSLESNDEPIYTARYTGDAIAGAEVDELKKEFDCERGIVLQFDSWHADVSRPGVWSVKFYVPIPIWLFRGRDTRIFRLEALARVLDDRSWTDMTVQSNTCFDGISHLRMEGAVQKRRVTI
jgi:hypothetical protein